MSHRGASDSHFAVAVGYRNFLGIIDDEWAQDCLSDDEVGYVYNEGPSEARNKFCQVAVSDKVYTKSDYISVIFITRIE